MAVTKPNLIASSASMYGVKRARDGAANRSMAQNAAMGLDNFSRLLQSDPSAAQNFMPQGQGLLGGSMGAAANRELMKAAGLEGAQPFSPNMANLPGQPAVQRAMANPNLRNMDAIQKAMQESSKPLSMVQGLRSLESARLKGSDGAVLNMKSTANKVKAVAETAAEVVESVVSGIGKLASLFESGREGVAAIGYDKVGGTSYGTYQIASNTGTFDEFLKYLDKHSPDYAKELRKAGEANTGSKNGAVPDAWRNIAGRDPEGFAALQQGFIEEQLYGPAARRLGEQGIDEARFGPVMREVLFSTAVQHGAGGAARIVGRAMQGVNVNDLLSDEGTPGVNKTRAEEMAIKRIYEIRQRQFESSTPYVREAVSNRLNSEMQMALNMLKTGNLA